MKKILALALAVMMMVTVFAACGGSQPSTSAPAPAASTAPAADASSAAEPVVGADQADLSKEVNLTWMYTGNNVVDQSAVVPVLNDYLKEKINATLEMIWCGWGDFDERVMMSINGGDPIDIYFTCSWTANEYVKTAKSGAFLRLDDPETNLLGNFAPDLFASIPSVLSDAALVEGASGFGVYAVPTYKEIAQQYYYAANGNILEKYGLTIDTIPGYYELDSILETVKAGEGKDFYPFGADITVLERAANNADMVDTKALLAYYFDPVNPSKSGDKLSSAYESEQFKKFVEKQREYYLKGYINPLVSNKDTMSQSWVDQQKSGQLLVDVFPYYPGIEVTWTQERGYPVEVAPVSAGIITTMSSRGAMNAISATSANPDRAMMLLNLVNSDPFVRTTLTYGVEGVQFTKEGDRIQFTEKKADYGVWPAGLGKLTLLPLQVADTPDLWEKFDVFNNAESLPTLGFSFDTEPVKTEYAVLSNVVDEYQYPLLSGSVDPAEKLPEFIEKLKANGLDKVVEEANRQLADFMANK